MFALLNKFKQIVKLETSTNIIYKNNLLSLKYISKNIQQIFYFHYTLTQLNLTSLATQYIYIFFNCNILAFGNFCLGQFYK